MFRPRRSRPSPETVASFRLVSQSSRGPACVAGDRGPAGVRDDSSGLRIGPVQFGTRKTSVMHLQKFTDVDLKTMTRPVDSYSDFLTG